MYIFTIQGYCILTHYKRYDNDRVFYIPKR